MTLAERIIELRDALGWSQKDLAARAGVTDMAISHIECNRRQPGLSLLDKVRRAFGVTWGHLLDDKDIIFKKRAAIPRKKRLPGKRVD